MYHEAVAQLFSSTVSVPLLVERVHHEVWLAKATDDEVVPSQKLVCEGNENAKQHQRGRFSSVLGTCWVASREVVLSRSNLHAWCLKDHLPV